MKKQIENNSQNVRDVFKEKVEIRALYNIPSLVKYENWTKVSRFLGTGLIGIEMRDINTQPKTKTNKI